MLRCHIYRMDCRRGNLYKCLCMIRSFQVSLTDFPESPVITRFGNVVQLAPFIVFHSLRTVLAVSGQVSPFTQTGLLCNETCLRFHTPPPVVKSKKLSTKLFGLYSGEPIISHRMILNRYLLFNVYKPFVFVYFLQSIFHFDFHHYFDSKIFLYPSIYTTHYFTFKL